MVTPLPMGWRSHHLFPSFHRCLNLSIFTSVTLYIYKSIHQININSCKFSHWITINVYRFGRVFADLHFQLGMVENISFPLLSPLHSAFFLRQSNLDIFSSTSPCVCPANGSFPLDLSFTSDIKAVIHPLNPRARPSLYI